MKLKSDFMRATDPHDQKPKSSTGGKQTVTYLDRAPRSECVEVLDLPRSRNAARMLGQVGVCLHEKLRVVSTAPLGGPVLVEAGGTVVAIGRSLAKRIKVRLTGGA